MEELYIMTTSIEEEQDQIMEEQENLKDEVEDKVIQEKEEVDYSEILKGIERTLQIISENQIKENENNEQYFEELLRVYSVGGISDNDVSDNQNEYITVSEDNIMNKHINDYTVTESLLLFIVLGILFGGFVALVRKAVYKWK